jgi:hypothetical protein
VKGRCEDGYWSAFGASRNGEFAVVLKWLNCCLPAIETNFGRGIGSSALVQSFYRADERSRVQEWMLGVHNTEVRLQ